MIPYSLLLELKNKMTFKRLSKLGLFQQLPIDPEYLPVKPEVTLHRAVLDKALLDLFVQDKKIKDDVLKWLDIKNPDFLESCKRAVLDPDQVYETFATMRKVIDG